MVDSGQKYNKLIRKFISIVCIGAFLCTNVLSDAREISSTLSPKMRMTMPEFQEHFQEGYALLSHEAVNDYIKEQIQEAGGFEKLRQRDVRICRDADAEEIEAKIVAIPGLFSERGQFAHTGLGKHNGKPIIYIDKTFYYDEEIMQNAAEEIPKADKKQIARHEFDEVHGWEDLSDELGVPLSTLRDSWIIANPEAKEKDQELHNYNEFSTDYLFDRYEHMLNWETLYNAYLQYGLDKYSKDVNIAARSKKFSDERIMEVLGETNGHQKEAAKRLGIAESTVSQRIKAIRKKAEEGKDTDILNRLKALGKEADKGSPASLLLSIKEDNNLFFNAMIHKKGISLQDIMKNRSFSETTLRKEIEILVDLGIFVPVEGKKGYYIFSELMRDGQDIDATKKIIDLVIKIEHQVGKKGETSPLNRYEIPKDKIQEVREIIEEKIVVFKGQPIPQKRAQDGMEHFKQKAARKGSSKLVTQDAIEAYNRYGYFGALEFLGITARNYFNLVKNLSERDIYLTLNYDEARWLIDNPQERKPYGTLFSIQTARNLILAALDTIPGFKEAREANNIKHMVQLYRRYAINYQPRDKKKYPWGGQASFFTEAVGLSGLMSNKKPYLRKKGSPAELLRVALPDLIDLTNPEALDPLEVEKSYWTDPENAKYHILQALDTIPGFKEAREDNNVKRMAQLYRKNVIGYEATDKEKYQRRGQTLFFYEIGGLAGLMSNLQAYFRKSGSPAELLRLALPDLIDLTNPDALDPLEVELHYWTDKENAKYHILQTLNTIPGFKEAREDNDIKHMVQLYRRYVINYRPRDKKKYPRGGQTSFFHEVGRLGGLMVREREYFKKQNSPAELIRLVLPELIDLTKADALDPLEVEKFYWTDPDNAKYHILQTLDTIPGFKEAREDNNIKRMAQLYRKNVIEYEPKNKEKHKNKGQQSFFREVGGLAGLMAEKQEYFKKTASPAELVRLSIPGLIDSSNPDALQPREVEKNVVTLKAIDKNKGSPASLLLTIKDDNTLFFGAMMHNKGISLKEIMANRDFSETTLRKEIEILVALGIVVPVEGKQGYYLFSEMMRGDELEDTKKIIDVIINIEHQVGEKGETRPLNRYEIPKEKIQEVKQIIEEKIAVFKGKTAVREAQTKGGMEDLKKKVRRKEKRKLQGNDATSAYNKYGYFGALNALGITADRYYNLIKGLSDRDKYLTITYDEAKELVGSEERKPRGIYLSKKTAKNIILAALDAVPGFAEARARGDIKQMKKLYLKYVKGYKSQDKEKYPNGGQQSFFVEECKLSGLLTKKEYFKKAGSPAELLRLALPGLIDLTNPDALDPLDVELHYWTDPENAKYHILQALDTIPGFARARVRDDIKQMKELYLKYVKGYKSKDKEKYPNGGQASFFCEVGGLAGLMMPKRPYFRKTGSPAELLRLALPGLIHLTNPDALDPLDVESHYWTYPENAKYHILQALDTIDGFKTARLTNDIKTMAELYREHVIVYKSQDKEKYPKGGQGGFFREVGGLSVLMATKQSYFKKMDSPAELVRLALPGLIDANNPDALHPDEVEGLAFKVKNMAREKGSPASLLLTIKDDNTLFFGAMLRNKGISLKEIMANRDFSETTLRKEIEILVALGIFVPTAGKQGYYIFSEMMRGDEIEDTKDIIDAVVKIEHQVGQKGETRPLNRFDIPQEKREEVKRLIKNKIAAIKGIRSGRKEQNKSGMEHFKKRVTKKSKVKLEAQDAIDAYKKYGYLGALDELGISSKKYYYLVKDLPDSHYYLTITYEDAVKIIAKPGGQKPFGTLQSEETARNLVVAALDTIRGFKEARLNGDIKTMKEVYLKYVKGYKSKDKTKYPKNGQYSFFAEACGLAGLMNTPIHFRKTGSPAELLRLAIPGLINLTNPDALDPLDVELHYWTDPENAKYHILQALDTIPGFKKAREEANIKRMKELYLTYVKGYESKNKNKYPNNGQYSFFCEAGGIGKLMSGSQAYFKKTKSPAELLRRAVPELIDLTNPEALDPIDIEHYYWTDVENAKYHILQALDTIPGFKEVRVSGDIKQMAILYKRYVMKYKSKYKTKYGNVGGQRAFFREVGGLIAILTNDYPYLKERSPAEFVRLVLPELVDPKNPDALDTAVLKNARGNPTGVRRNRTTFASLLDNIKNNKELLGKARNEGFNVKEDLYEVSARADKDSVLWNAIYNGRIKTLEEIGILVCVNKENYVYRFSDMMIGPKLDENYTRTMINAINDIRYKIARKEDKRPLHNGTIPEQEEQTVKELIKMTILNQINIRLEPVIPKDKVLWHIIEEDVLCFNQKFDGDFVTEINKFFRTSETKEKVRILRNGETIQSAIEEIEKGNADAVFDAALSSEASINKVPEREQEIKMLVFKGGVSNYTQLEGVIAALRALHENQERIIPSLQLIYKILTGAAFDKNQIEMLIASPKELARSLVFNLPPAEGITGNTQELNVRLREFITAA